MLSKPTIIRLPFLLVLMALPACTLMPDYKRPGAPIASFWGRETGEDAATAQSSNVASLNWQDFFTTPELKNLIAKGLDNNRDLREAALNIEVARAEYRVQRSELLPTIDAQGSLTRQRTPGTVSPTGRSETSSTYEANIGTTAFELDLFGRLRSLSRAQFEEYLATTEARNTVQIALVAEIANTYLTLLADREQYDLATQTLDAQQRSYDIAKKRFDAGIGTKLDLRQVETLLETAKVDQIAYSRLIAQDKNLLDLLVGTPVAETEIAATFASNDPFINDLIAGLPSDLLRNRPDIREAEHLLKAANANIGAARAAFFPNITLTGAGGTAGDQLSQLFKGGSGAWSFIPQVTLPIFTAGRNKANLDLATLRKDIYIARYEGAIQTAFREVADALVGRATLDDELAAQRRLVAATQDAFNIAQRRYQTGIDNYLTVLDSRRELYAAQQGEIVTRLAMMQNYVTLYASLGGGQNRPIKDK